MKQSEPLRAALTAPAAVVLVALAWLPAAAAVVVATVLDASWAAVLRLVVTALVYAPLAALLLRARRRALTAIVAALATSSGWLALAVVGDGLEGPAPSAAEALALLLFLARQTENAALGVLPWLFARAGRTRVAGVALGIGAIAADTVLSASASLGAAVPHELRTLPLAAAVASFAIAALVLAVQRRGHPQARLALGCFVVGGALLVASYSRLLVPASEPLLLLACDVAFVLAQALLPTGLLGILVADRALVPDRALVAGVTWAQSLAFAISLYLVVDALARASGLPATVAGAGAAGALALAFSGMNAVIERRTVRLYFGQGADAREVLGRLGARLGSVEGPPAALLGIAESLREVWSLSSVTIAPAGEGTPLRAGEPGRHRIIAELRAGGRGMGQIELSSDDPAALHGTVAPVFDEISGLIAVAVLLAGINQEVATTRRRTLGVRRQERRLLHHQLHDELAPALAGLVFGLTAAQRLVLAGAPNAPQAVAGLRHEVAERAEEVRRIARTLLPASLDAGDLDDALRELARRFTGHGVAVTVRSSGADVLDTAVQLAVYLVLAEAIAGLRRLPGANRIDAGLVIHDDRVVIELGTPLAPPGAGDAAALGIVAAVEQRARELGGRAALRTAPVVSGGPSDGIPYTIEVVIPR